MFEYATVFLYCCRPFLRQGCKFVWLAVRIVCQYHSLLTILITAIQLFNSGQNAASYIGITSGFTRLYDQWEISCFQYVSFFSLKFDLIAVIVMSFWVYSYCRNMTSYRFFQDGGRGRSVLVRFVFVDVLAFRRSKSVNKPNFVDISGQVKSSRFFENTNWQYAVAYNIDTI